MAPREGRLMEHPFLLLGILCVLTCPMIFGAITLLYSMKNSGHHNE